MIQTETAHAAPERARRKNRPAIFVLAPLCSGADLLHGMLRGHSGLFAPPELELLTFTTLEERRRAFPEPDDHRLAGAVEAVRQIRGRDTEEARRIVEAGERDGLTILDFYALLQGWLGDRVLVDGTSSYALDPEALRRAEEGFEDAFYIHLIRHPRRMVRSFEAAGIDPIFLRTEHGFTRRELAEAIWTVGHQNIVEFLGRVSPQRQHRLRLEDLLANPTGELWALCRSLGLELEPATMRSVADAHVDGLAEDEDGEDFLGEVSWELATGFGYGREAGGWESIEVSRRAPGMPQPLSFAQERLWILDRLHPGNTAYNVPLSFRLRGVLDRAAFHASLGEIVDRHEVLRTRFVVLAGEPVQVVAPTAPLPLPAVSLFGLPAARRARELERLIGEESARPFNLAAGPLLRAGLIELGPEDQAFVLTLHHIVSDGWSMGVLVSELRDLYSAFSKGERSPLPELPIQYADFARWQRRRLSGATLDAELSFWGERLRDLPVLELSTDRPRRGAGAALGERLHIVLPAALAEGVGSLARREGATSFVALLAAVDVVLQRYIGKDDVRVGSPIANRNRAELERLVGFFANTLVLRSDLGGHPTFAELLGRVKRTVFEAHSHQELPFDKLVSTLHPDRDLSRTPLFQVMFVLQNAPAPPLAMPGLTLEPLAAAGGAAKFDLTITLGEEKEGLSGFAEYDPELFHATTIRRLMGHLERLLAGCLAEPDRPISTLTLLSAPERHELVVEWNDTRGPRRPATGLHELFERQAARTPDGVAVIAGGERATYRQLNQRANRLARFLARRGVGPEVRVGVLCDRSLAMVTALLATLKAGGAYVPLDRAYPPERSRFILRHARVALLLTDGEPAERATFEGDFAVVDLADAAADIAAMPETDPAPAARPGNLAYLIYTSGSTGLPKGVAIEHRSPVERVHWAADEFSRDDLAGVLASTSICFDLSVFELFAPLCWGGSAILAENALALPDLPAAGEVTLINTVPSAMAALLARPLPPSVRTVSLAGEPLTAALAERIHRAAAPARLLNLYGPSEDTTYSTGARIGAGDQVSIGRPLPGTRAHVLDRCCEPLPVGVPGDLYLAGAGLARGYLERPELTAAAFVPDPFGGEPGERLYRTGDRVRRLPDGSLDFLGRVDDQVKLRGYRIELREIEAALAAHPDVGEAVVVLREEPSGSKSLAAYASPRAGAVLAALTAGELLAFLRERLPEPMIPASVTLLAEMPRLPNGKVDRRALPAPALATVVYTAPRNAAEERLADIWRSLFRLDRVGVDDNFFELGGDSILAIQVAFRASQAGLHLTPRQLFDRPTIALLAQGVEALPAPEPAAAPVAGPVPLTPIQRWFFEQGLPHREHFNQSLLLELAPPHPARRVEPALLRQALACLLENHAALRMRFLSPGPAPRTAWEQIGPARAEKPRLLQIDLAALARERREVAFEAAATALQASFDLAEGPLFGAALFAGSADEPEHLLLACHHLVVDAVSWRILLDDLETAYGRLARGEPPALQPTATPFERWAERLAAHAASPAVGREAPFWLSALDEPVTSLPVDLTVGENDVASSRTLAVLLDGEGTRALLQVMPRAYRTRINDVLLTALAQALAGWTGERRHQIDLEGHGREEIAADLDVSRTVGWFTTLFPVVLDLGATADPGAALKRVKEHLRSIPGNGLGYGLLRCRGEEGVRAALRSRPAAELVFNYLGQLDGAVAEGRFLRLAAGSTGRLRDPQQRRAHLFEVTASVLDGRFQASWTYSANRHLPATVAALAQGFRRSLEELIGHSLSAEAGGCTPSDFPLARLGQEELDVLVRSCEGEVDDVYPATPVQQGMLFHSLSAGDSGVYVGQTSLTFERDLDLTAFERAWEGTLAAHPVLRTSFYWGDLDKPLQVVRRRARLPWDRRDWRGKTDGEQRRAMAELLREDRHRGFDPTRPPLWRLALIRLADDRYGFVWSVHHALLDGWSVPILLRELFGRYEAGHRGEEYRPERAGRPYRDYVEWLLRHDLAAAERFWRLELAGFVAPTSLGIGRAVARSPSAQVRHGTEILALSAADTEALQLFARRRGLTLNTLAQGAWGLLLHRYGGDDEVVFGAVASGRSAPVPGIEEMVGLFINTLAVRIAVDSAASPAPWLQSLQERQAAARQHEHTPLSRVQQWSEMRGGQALFESILVFENYPADEAVREQIAGSLRVGEVDVREQTNYPLTLAVAGGSHLGAKLLYDAERFDPAGAARLLRHFASLLLGMAAGEDRPLGSLSLLSPAERRQLLEWGTGAPRSLAETSVPEVFARRAARFAGLPAIRFEGGELTYVELDGRANRVARLLRRRGVAPGSLVGLATERSLDLAVGLLGIWKAGGAYVPLDPTYPADRLAFTIEDSGLRTLLTSGQVFADPLDGDDVRVIRLDAEREALAAESPQPLEESIDPRSLAYVIYTSGSTGRPKGVQIEHASLAGVLDASIEELSWDADDRALSLAPFSFDIFLFELFCPLLVGGLCTLMPLGPMLDLDRVVALAAGVTRLHAVPALMRQVVEGSAREGRGYPHLRTLFVGGDEVPLDLLQAMRRTFPAAEIRILYGPTEGTIICSSSRLAPGEEPRRSVIGRPLPGAEICLKDRQGRSVPAGVPGEIWIGGAGVGRGYLGREALTAERFPVLGGRRFYRTGDLARWLDDGELEFLGRIDQQVKIRGFRVEPGEVEAVLRAHPEVGDVAVVAHDGASGKYLAAYLVPVAGEAPAPAALRAFLRARIPEHMIPAVFVPLAALPLMPNGKLDRGTLPVAEARRAQAYAAPRTAVEKVLAGIWLRVLKVDQVGVDDNFFDLGGHSLLATQIASRVRRTFRVDLPLSSFFGAATVAELAEVVVAHEIRPGLAETIALALQAARSRSVASGETPGARGGP